MPIFSLAERQGHPGSGLVGRGRRRGVQQKELRKGRLACRSEDATQKRAQSGWPRLSMVTNYSSIFWVKQVSLSEVASGEGFFEYSRLPGASLEGPQVQNLGGPPIF